MRTKLFAVFDSKVGAFMNLFQAPTAGAALRSFHQAALDPKSGIAAYPGDYTLMEVGEFDDQSGQVYAHEAHFNHGTGLQVLSQLAQVDARQLQLRALDVEAARQRSEKVAVNGAVRQDPDTVMESPSAS